MLPSFFLLLSCCVFLLSSCLFFVASSSSQGTPRDPQSLPKASILTERDPFFSHPYRARSILENLEYLAPSGLIINSHSPRARSIFFAFSTSEIQFWKTVILTEWNPICFYRVDIFVFFLIFFLYFFSMLLSIYHVFFLFFFKKIQKIARGRIDFKMVILEKSEDSPKTCTLQHRLYKWWLLQNRENDLSKTM